MLIKIKRGIKLMMMIAKEINKWILLIIKLKKRKKFNIINDFDENLWSLVEDLSCEKALDIINDINNKEILNNNEYIILD